MSAPARVPPRSLAPPRPLRRRFRSRGGAGAWSRFEGLGFRVEDVGLRAEGSGLRVEDVGLRVEGVGCRVKVVGLRVEG